MDAIKKMRTVLDKIDNIQFEPRDPDLPGAPRWVAGSIIGGRNRDYDLAGPYNIPDFCTIIVDFRYPPGYTIEEINDRFKEMLEGAESQEEQALALQIALSERLRQLREKGEDEKAIRILEKALDLLREGKVEQAIRCVDM